MAGYVNVTVVGGLGKDPDIRSTQSGKRIANFSVAVDQGWGESKKTEWISVVCFQEKLVELVEKYLKKGKQVALSGTLQTSSWEDKTSGQKKYKTEVVARDITFMDSGSSSSRTTTAPRAETVPQTRSTQPVSDNPFDQDDSIPF